ncbi:MAG: hypothetical protein R3C58_03040 [Parvularculaceae bacterium]
MSLRISALLFSFAGSSAEDEDDDASATEGARKNAAQRPAAPKVTPER